MVNKNMGIDAIDISAPSQQIPWHGLVGCVDDSGGVLRVAGRDDREQWLARYPWARNPQSKMVISGGEINGGFCMPFSEMLITAVKEGFVVPEGATDEEILALIEAYEDALKAAPIAPSAEERIAAALEYQNLLTM